jgi:hypothetical protein
VIMQIVMHHHQPTLRALFSIHSARFWISV